MMQIFFRMGDKASIVHTYQTCEKSMHRIFDLPPSAETKNLYHDLIPNSKNSLFHKLFFG